MPFQPPSIEDYAWAWLSRRRVRGRPLSPITVQTYRWLLSKHVLPHLGSCPVPDLTRAEVRRWHATLSVAPGPSTAAKCYRLLTAIFRTAVEDEVVAKSPCSLRGAGQDYSPERPLLSLRQVLSMADAVGPLARDGPAGRLRLPAVRRERRSAPRLPRPTAPSVRVVASVRDLAGGVRYVGPPKSRAGRRVVALPPAILPDLHAHVDAYAEPAPEGLVFVGPLGGPLRASGFGTKVWRPATVTVGLPGLHFHDLRHAGATMAAAAGATLAELMARLGHSSDALPARLVRPAASR